jgi:hypothetical protein
VSREIPRPAGTQPYQGDCDLLDPAWLSEPLIEFRRLAGMRVLRMCKGITVNVTAADRSRLEGNQLHDPNLGGQATPTLRSEVRQTLRRYPKVTIGVSLSYPRATAHVGRS